MGGYEKRKQGSNPKGMFERIRRLEAKFFANCIWFLMFGLVFCTLGWLYYQLIIYWWGSFIQAHPALKLSYPGYHVGPRPMKATPDLLVRNSQQGREETLPEISFGEALFLSFVVIFGICCIVGLINSFKD
jgi:hypothetical protein